MKKFFAVGLSAVLLLQATVYAGTLSVGAESAEDPVSTVKIADMETVGDGNSFFNYYGRYQDSEVMPVTVRVAAENFVLSGCNLENADGKTVAKLTEGSAVSFKVQVDKAGLYPFAFGYYSTDEVDSNYMVSLKLNGTAPYDEAENLSLSRVWTDALNGEFEKDDYGNDIRPSQKTINEWCEAYVYDTRCLYNIPYAVYLDSGVSTLTVTSESNTLLLESVVLGLKAADKNYDEYSAEKKLYEGESIVHQAEIMYRKSNSTLYQTYDRTNSATQPQSPKYVLLNTVGKSTWNKNGDYISWQPDISEAGWYCISLRVRQNENQGMNSYRTLRINDEIPFEEAESIPFEYNAEWYIKTIGDNEPYMFWLQPGDVISLTVSSGAESEALRLINYYTLWLNELYRDIICITGTTPDTYRDYMLSDQLPELEEKLGEIAEGLTEVSKIFEGLTGTKGSNASILDYVSGILKEFAYDCNEIPGRLSSFQGLLENLGSLQTTIGQQPLEIDYFTFSSEEALPKNANNSFFKQTGFAISAFLASFASDYGYSSDPSSADNTINVWATVGRDQAKIINNLIRNGYNSTNKKKVKLSIVSGGDILIKASLAGKGPDVALLAGIPLELAARGALVPLTDYDFGNLKDEFVDSIWNSMSYNGEIYALPETLTFSALFYRKDILEEYKIDPPSTWDDFYKSMEELQKNNLTVGIPEVDSANYGVSQGISIFSMFLVQNGGTYYNDSLTETAFNTNEAFDAFERWVDLYKLYGNSRDFSFYSRFRTGEMPISIQNYSSYNQIASAAPEIDGLWSFASIPGTVKEDGSVSRSQVGNATGCYMLKSAIKKGVDKEAFEFMKWWVSADTQTEYGKELEATMGIAGRYTPANKVALNNLGWSNAEKRVLNELLNDVVLVEQVPGNYLLPRSLTTAFRSSVTGENRARRALTIANKEINDELARKREEFNLD